MNLTGILNTPGYFYALGYTMTMGLMLRQEKNIRGKGWTAGICAATALFIWAVLYLTRESGGLVFILSMASVAGGMTLGFFLCLRDGPRSVFLTVRAFLLGELVASLVWQICYSLAVRYEAFLNPVLFYGSMAVLFLVSMTVIHIFETRIHRDQVRAEITWREAVLTFLIGLSTFIVSNLSYAAPGGMFSGSQARDVFAIRTLVDFSGCVILYSYHLQLIDVQRRLEKDALWNIQNMQYRAYQISRESMDMVNSKYHDLKHQITLLRSQIEPGKGTQYLDQMEQEIRSYAAGNITGHPVLDAVLTNKSHFCQSRGIEFKYMADGKPLRMMSDMEVAALFGNMLDNAIEGTERVSDPGKRMIRLQVSTEKSFLRIRLENTCGEKLHFDGGLPLTTKQDKRYHGFGMKSMNRTVTKYGGSLVTSQKDDWFELKILIPLEQGRTGQPEQGCR